MADTRSQDTVAKIQAAWTEAQAQLRMLQKQVEQTTALAQVSVRLSGMDRALDAAYRELGAAVWSAVEKNALKLPASLTGVARAIERVRQEAEAEKSAVRSLLAEGDDLATGAAKQRALKAGQKPVTAKEKKR